MATTIGNFALSSGLLEQYRAARQVTDSLFAIVHPDAIYDRPIGERHRIIFYIGHLEAFDWNLLRDRALGAQVFDEKLDRLFAFGIDPVDGGLPKDEPGDWPSIETVQRYVSRIRETIDQHLSALDSPQKPEFDPVQLLNVAIEHRLMHAETLAYMLHQLPISKKIASYEDPAPVSRIVQPEMVRIPAGRATLGLRRNSGQFGWDNEFEQQTINVAEFDIDRYMVTNAEYLDFIHAGGYHEPKFWKDSDWNWKAQHNVEHPVFWKRIDGGWTYRTMFQEIALPLEWPVYVSHAEASAYAKWTGKRLPSEAEWHRAAYGDNSLQVFPWGDVVPKTNQGNFDFQRWNPTPVGSFPSGESPYGLSDMVGNGWEWTSTVFGPLPGFKPFSFYLGYSADFFDNKHYVLKGGSTRTAASMLRRSFRNWFQPQYQYVYAGFRCVREV
ncbi:MAG TPA: SUMF1/EgtB/PvdO family nonheme iron enzyme [Terriglobales bacterium]|jgi:gamma-glutamyl hercynylcysteine S-oxide synthase|nr:SUMF1/EgtB/PvdO family nonheme iron enzyme [Terriglobales bacterium]